MPELGDNWYKYYTPPPEWSYEAIKERYAILVKTYGIAVPLPLEYDYAEIIKVKFVLQDISQGIKDNDLACVAVATDFIIAPVFFHYSGYIRATMARRLKKGLA